MLAALLTGVPASARALAGRLRGRRPAAPRALAEATITLYRDGPLLVRGPFTLRRSDGAELPVRRRVVALCRCGRSRLPPFCDGSHHAAGFRDPRES
jgi:CDGSH-type Zn-finger protein